MGISKNGKTRVSVTLSDELLKTVDEIARSYGSTRASMCAYFIGQGCASTMKAFNAFERFCDRQVEEADRMALNAFKRVCEREIKESDGELEDT